MGVKKVDFGRIEAYYSDIFTCKLRRNVLIINIILLIYDFERFEEVSELFWSRYYRKTVFLAFFGTKKGDLALGEKKCRHLHAIYIMLHNCSNSQ